MPSHDKVETLNLAPRDIVVRHTDDCPRHGKTQVRFMISLAGALVVVANCPSCGIIPIQPE